MNKRLWAYLGLLAVAATGLAGCSSVTSGGPTPDGGPVGSEGTPQSGDAGAPPGKQSCEAYLKCLSDVGSAEAGAAVALYGDASPCWKGSSSDATACGNACTKALESVPACSVAVEGTYLAVCDPDFGGFSQNRSRILFGAQLQFASGSGSLVLQALPFRQEQFDTSAALTTLPKIPLGLADDGLGAGLVDRTFEIPEEAWTNSSRPTEYIGVSVARMKPVKGGICGSLGLTLVDTTSASGGCLFYPIADGNPIPHPNADDVWACVFRGAR